MENQEFKAKYVYHPSGEVRLAVSEEIYLSYKERGYLDEKEEIKPKSVKNEKTKAKVSKKDDKKA